ncbi:MAG: Cell division protein FtsZ [Candidatus Curtissbacteria bacterium GW2011_GWA1_40_24]|uniref:Cell division protein FtsZ n=2 Tax=Patescibacteria group TaxID=1783273 RepID=A0A0G0U879_9BACT|nr:MAG: Cell division protein FtsZ [Candidatus Curtissbacteria bacterium GW2011_GWA1_40_24]KKR89010.1 MAG: Cell division protein FtsZ [Candidatus Wolfebacteria bacterium GW2011_GWB1_41_12]
MRKKTKIKSKAKLKNQPLAKIKVIGVGGAGGNAVTRMNEGFIKGIDLIAVNTDIQDLDYTAAKKRIYIGKNLTKGLGTGMDPELGRKAAEESQAEIAEILDGADMVFLTAGFGGGTGTGALPVVAEIAKDMGILTVAVVTKPFVFEGYERMRIAEEGIMRTKDRVDTLITIPNDRIFSIINKNTSLTRAFEEIDEVLKNSVLGIAELITMPGIINIDFADVKAIISNAGSALIGAGIASGNERAINAANLAINSPLLEISINGAKRVLFSVSGHRDLKMSEINEIARLISEQVNSSAKIIFGAHHDRKLKKGELKVTLVAAGFNGELKRETGILPNLFISEVLPEKNEIKEDKDKERKKENKKEEKEKSDIWEIPTFLRKKKR